MQKDVNGVSATREPTHHATSVRYDRVNPRALGGIRPGRRGSVTDLPRRLKLLRGPRTDLGPA